MGLDIASLEKASATILELNGRLDGDTTASLSTAIEAIDEGAIIIDMANCNYISSAGLRVFLITHQDFSRQGRSLSLVNLSALVYSVFEVSGFNQILNVTKSPRRISIHESELISSGACGDCYRLDSETVVKLYREGVAVSVAEKEKRYSKAAFLMGLPTAISYDVVVCGARSGVVYEMIDAELFSTIIRDNPENTEKHAQLLSAIAKKVHSIRGDDSIFPSIKNQFQDYIDEMHAFLPRSDIEFLQERLRSIPESTNCVHFDLHSSNIMMRKGEPVIIDLGDFSVGSYLFDLGLIYMIYGLPDLGFCEMVTKIPSDQGVRLCESFIQSYFADMTPEDYKYFYQNRFFLASLRAIYTITFLPQMRSMMIEAVRDYLLPRMRASY